MDLIFRVYRKVAYASENNLNVGHNLLTL